MKNLWFNYSKPQSFIVCTTPIEPALIPVEPKFTFSHNCFSPVSNDDFTCCVITKRRKFYLPENTPSNWLRGIPDTFSAASLCFVLVYLSWCYSLLPIALLSRIYIARKKKPHSQNAVSFTYEKDTIQIIETDGSSAGRLRCGCSHCWRSEKCHDGICNAHLEKERKTQIC